MNKHCTVADCYAPTVAQGLCNRCYARKRRNGEIFVRLSPRHGYRRTLIYGRWCSMISRCENPNVPTYSYYGGRGIKVCDRWHSFQNFYTDMGEPPKGHTLDRIDSDGDYSPLNCRWSDRVTQSINRRTNKNNHSGYRGVVIEPGGHYRAQIGFSGDRIYIGTFNSPDEAAWMRDQWAIALHGYDAQLNFGYF